VTRSSTSILLCAFALVCLVGASPAAAKKHCPKGDVRHKSICLRPVRIPAKVPAVAPTQAILTAAAHVPAKGHRRIPAARLRAALKHLKGIDALTTAIGALGPSATTRAVGPIARAADDGAVSGGGWSGTSTVDIPLHESQTGTDVTVHVDASKEGTGAKVTETRKDLIADCPDSKGNVAGSAERSHTLSLDIPIQDGYEVKVAFGYKATFVLEGHTTDTGEFHDWQQTMSYLAHAQVAILHNGKVIATNAPLVWTMHATKDLNPNDLGYSSANLTELHVPGEFHVFGKTFYPTGTPEARATDGILELADILWHFVASDARDNFQNAQKYHWDQGDCMPITLSAPKTQLQPGEAVDVTAQLTAPKSDGVAHAALTAAASGASSVSPTATSADAAPVHFTVVAPTPFDQNTGFRVFFNAVSHQGHSIKTIEFTRQPSDYTLHFTYTQSGDPSYHYDTSSPSFTDYGDFTEHRDLAISGTVPLTANPDGTYSGNGAVTWDRFDWTSDNDNTSSNNAGGTCTIDYATTHSSQAAGTLAVKGLTLGAQPTAKFTLGGLADHIHTDETPEAGPCPGFTQDDDQPELLNSFYNQHYTTTGNPSYGTDGNGNITSVTITLASGWAGASSNVVQSWTTSGAMYGDGPNDPPDAIHFTETYTITTG